mmetsp:Transcript_37725/g.88180  ORF Transcript_37725/g.88180 Transcript_37725/m.88180 type:complete len:88 (+) Transcript_37725:22-285(+)
MSRRKGFPPLYILTILANETNPGSLQKVFGGKVMFDFFLFVHAHRHRGSILVDQPIVGRTCAKRKNIDVQLEMLLMRLEVVQVRWEL